MNDEGKPKYTLGLLLKNTGCKLNINSCPKNDLIHWISEKYNI